MSEEQYLKNLEEEKNIRIETAQNERAAYLAELEERCVDDDGDETISSYFTETYKRYYETFRTEFERNLFEHMDEIHRFPNLNTQYWRSLLSFTWNALNMEQKNSLFERFASMEESRWVTEENLLEVVTAPSIPNPFIPKAAAIVIIAMASNRFEESKMNSVMMLNDFMWLECNTDMRDWDKVYRDIDGWGIVSSKPSNGLIPDIHMEMSAEYFEELLRDSISLDDEIKRRIIDYYETYSLEQIEGLIEVMETERKSFFLLAIKDQISTVRELVETKQREWNEISSYYGRSES